MCCCDVCVNAFQKHIHYGFDRQFYPKFSESDFVLMIKCITKFSEKLIQTTYINVQFETTAGFSDTSNYELRMFSYTLEAENATEFRIVDRMQKNRTHPLIILSKTPKPFCENAFEQQRMKSKSTGEVVSAVVYYRRPDGRIDLAKTEIQVQGKFPSHWFPIRGMPLYEEVKVTCSSYTEKSNVKIFCNHGVRR